MIALSVNSLLTGYLYILGATFCKLPDLIYVSGSIGLGTWAGACLYCLILALNRLFDLWNPILAEMLFNGSSITIWLLLPVIYSLFFTFFTPPILFNSNQYSWFFSPMILNTPDEATAFHNFPHTVNNTLVVLATCIFYILLWITMTIKYGQNGVAMSSFQKSFSVICLANLMAALIYVYMNFFEMADWLLILGHICWAAGHGIPAFVYLTMNQTIKMKTKEFLLKATKRNVFTVSTVTIHHTMKG